MAYRLGKLPARPGAISFRFATYFDRAKLPTPPLVFGHERIGVPWNMLANDKFGNCVAEGTLVSAPDVEGAFKAPYVGDLITIRLASGKLITVTRKHSLLTPDGFAAADTLKQGQYLVGARGAQVLPWPVRSVRDHHFYDRPTPIDKVFSSLGFGGRPCREVMPVAVDFHGDEKFFDGNVEIVRANSLLGHEFQSPLGKPNTEDQVSAARQLKRMFVRAGASFLALWGRLLSSHGDIGFCGDGSPLRYAHAGVSKPERLPLRSEYLTGGDNFLFKVLSRQVELSAHALKGRPGHIAFNRGAYVAIPLAPRQRAVLGIPFAHPKASIGHPSDDGHATDANFFSDLCNAFPGLIEADRVMNIDVQRDVRTHVYDLSTASHWYIANGIISHNCVWAGAAHEHMVWTHESGPTAKFDDAGVLSDYAAATGFDPTKPDSDQGTDMSSAAEYRRKTGILGASGQRHKVDSYVALPPGRIDDLALATYLTGATGIGIRLPASAMDQFSTEKPWSVVAGSPNEGGHYVPCIGRNQHGHLIVITWGRIHAMTPAFYDKYCDEAVAYLSLEILRDKVSPEGFDAITLQEHLNALRKH